MAYDPPQGTKRYLAFALQAAFASLLVFLAVETVRAPVIEFGDGREYVIQTQSIAFDHALAVDPARRASYWNETNLFGVTLDPAPPNRPDQSAKGEGRQFGGRFGSLYLSVDGSLHYIHSWVYSLAVAPVYAALHVFAPGAGEFYAFRIINILCVCIPLVLLWRRRPTLATLLFFIAILASPITPHMQYAHSELFCFACVTLSFILVQSPRLRSVSPFILGVGAAQNIPIALLFPFHFWLMCMPSAAGRFSFRTVVLYACAAALPALILLYNYSVFGVPNLMSHIGQVSFSYLSVRKIVSVFVSPMIGALWYLPASWLGVVLAIGTVRAREIMLCIVSVLAVAVLSSSTANIQSAQLSACRYAVWYLAPLYVLPFLAGHTRSRPRWSTVLCWIGSTLLAAIMWWLGTYRMLLGDAGEFMSGKRATSEVASIYRWTHFNDDVEPIAESISGREIPMSFQFWGIYAWNVGEGQSMWLLSQRAAIDSPVIEVRSDAPLASLDSVREVFDVRGGRNGLYTLTIRPDVHFDRHPLYGGYLFVWVPATVAGMRAQAPVFIR